MLLCANNVVYHQLSVMAKLIYIYFYIRLQRIRMDSQRKSKYFPLGVDTPIRINTWIMQELNIACMSTGRRS